MLQEYMLEGSDLPKMIAVLNVSLNLRRPWPPAAHLCDTSSLDSAASFSAARMCTSMSACLPAALLCSALCCALQSFELEKDSTPATPTECFLFMLMMAIPGPEFAPGLAALLTEAITSGFLIKADVLAGMAAEMGFLAAIAALMEQKTSPHLPITCGQVSQSES